MIIHFLQCPTLPQGVSGFVSFPGSEVHLAGYWKYLCGRVHRCTSVQELLDQIHMALLGCQVQSIETILEKDKEGQVSPKLFNSLGSTNTDQMDREVITSVSMSLTSCIYHVNAVKMLQLNFPPASEGTSWNIKASCQSWIRCRAILRCCGGEPVFGVWGHK